MIHFEIPKNQSSIIKVIGVGGGGGNAVNYMFSLGIEGVDFVVCNTDIQALTTSPIPNKIQLGPHLTQGLGAGANPEIGKQASEESNEDITKILKVNTRMAFITAGMGGGTGTGGAPVVAKICRDLGILTVGIVTLPFTYEGVRRMKQAQEGIDRMREHVDTILIISNDKLRQQFGDLKFTEAFSRADDILATAAKCITDVITTTGQINVDFADVCTVMKNGGVAILGNASMKGENRALHAVEHSLNSPLLNDSDISGAKWILLNITSSAGEFEHTMDEVEAIQAYVQQQAGIGCDIILGMGHDPNLGESIAVTVIATGFNHRKIDAENQMKIHEPEKIVMRLENNGLEEGSNVQASENTHAHQVYSMEPKLVEDAPKADFNPSPAFPAADANATNEAPETTAKDDAPKLIIKENEAAAPHFNLVMKAAPVNDESMKVGPHTITLTPEEQEEKRQFEEKKRQLEERAERLRKASYNVKGSDNGNDLENVPAYIRRKMELDNSVKSADTFLSGYTVEVNNDPMDQQAFIGTKNTFLEGNKPD